MARTTDRRVSPFRPTLEPVEDRITPSGVALKHPLVHKPAVHGKIAAAVSILQQVRSEMAQAQAPPPAAAAPTTITVPTPPNADGDGSNSDTGPTAETARERKLQDARGFLPDADAPNRDDAGPALPPADAARAEPLGDAEHPVVDDPHVVNVRGRRASAPNIRHVHADGPGGTERLASDKPLVIEAEAAITTVAAEPTRQVQSVEAPPADVALSPAAEAAGLLAAFSPFDPQLVSAGVERFLAQLDAARGEVGDWLAHSDRLAPWVLTVATAVAAGEVGRRQVRRSIEQNGSRLRPGTAGESVEPAVV